MPRSTVTRIAVPNGISGNLAGFVHWPQGVQPLTSPPTQRSPPSSPRVVVLLCHPHPKLGGDANNNAIFHLSNILSNGMFLTGSLPQPHNVNNIPDGEALYDYIDRMPDVADDVVLPDLTFASDTTTRQTAVTPSSSTSKNQSTTTAAEPHISVCETMALHTHLQDENIASNVIPCPAPDTSVEYVSKFYGPLKVHELCGSQPPAKSVIASPDQSSLTASSDSSHVVSAVSDTSYRVPSTSNGVIAVRFHFSGCRHSDGVSSWTGSTEVQDVKTMLAWILSPQSGLFPTHLFLMGYSFGACVSASALASILSPQTTPAWPHLAAFHRVFRGVAFISLPAGFFARCLLGSHISNLRSLAGMLLNDSNQAWASPNTVPGVLFVQDDGDDFTSTSTLVDLVQSLPNSHPAMLRILETGSGHFWNGQEHVLASVLDRWVNQRLYSPVEPEQSSPSDAVAAATASVEEPNASSPTDDQDASSVVTSQPPAPLSSPPVLPTVLPLVVNNFTPPTTDYRPGRKQSLCFDMNVWFPALMVSMALGQLAFNRWDSTGRVAAASQAAGEVDIISGLDIPHHLQATGAIYSSDLPAFSSNEQLPSEIVVTKPTSDLQDEL